MNKYENQLLSEYNKQIEEELSNEEIVQQSTYIFYNVYEVEITGNDGCDCGLCVCAEVAMGVGILAACGGCAGMACLDEMGFDTDEIDLSFIGDSIYCCLDCCCF